MTGDHGTHDRTRIARRTVLRALGAGVAIGGLTASSTTATAASSFSYELAGTALDAGVEEVVVQGDWAYATNASAISTVDLSDPNAPVLGGVAAGHGYDNHDVKVDGDVAGLANDGSAGSTTNPGGVTFYDVSDPSSPVETAFYPTASGIHNHFIKGDYAYLCVNESGEASFSKARMEIVDVSDPADPRHVSAWRLYEHHPEMAKAGINPIHDIYVQDDLAYMCWWDAGVVVADVSDRTDPRAVAHFGAAPYATDTSMDTATTYQRYLGGERTNAHYVQPSPDGDYAFVGAETFPGPFEDTVVPGQHGGIRVFDTSDVSADSTPSDPYSGHVGYVPAPERPADAVHTSHNFDVADSKLFASFYQGGLRAYDLEDPTDPTELAAFAPRATAYWTAVDLPTAGPRRYTVGSDIGKGLVVLELVHETPGEQNWQTDDDLGPRDVLGPTMERPL